MHPFAPRRTIAQDKVATFMTMVCLVISTGVGARAHVLASFVLQRGLPLVVMTVLLLFSWLSLLYASDTLGLAFVAYTIEYYPGSRVVSFDYTTPK